jgi:glycosyltransferase involved in cell wall biosynthesis
VKLLVVSYFLPPILASESILIAKALRALVKAAPSSEITVLAATRSRLYSADPSLTRLLPETLQIVRSRPLESRSITLALQLVAPWFVYKPDPLRGWAWRSRPILDDLLKQERFDLLLTWGQPFSSHFLGLRAKRRTNSPWIAHMSDPLADNPFYRFRLNLHRRSNERLERSIFTEADEVHFVSEETAELSRRRYGQPLSEKFVVVPHAYDRSLYPPAAEKRDRTVLAHVGAFTGARNPGNLLRAFGILQRRSPKLARGVVLQFVGHVPQRYRRMAEELGLAGAVEFVGPVSYLESLVLMSRADQLIVIDAEFDTTNVFFPSKLVDYFGSGKPIISLTPPGGTTARLIREAGAGESVSPSDPERIATVLDDRLIRPVSYDPPARYDIAEVGQLLHERFRNVIGRRERHG